MQSDVKVKIPLKITVPLIIGITLLFIYYPLESPNWYMDIMGLIGVFLMLFALLLIWIIIFRWYADLE